MITIQEIVSTRLSAEVILHAGNVRACIFGKVNNYGDGGKFIISPGKDSPNSIIFDENSIGKIVKLGHHAVICLC